MKRLPRQWRQKIRSAALALQPVTRAVERVAHIAVHLQRPTVMGLVGVAGTAINSISDSMSEHNGPNSTVMSMIAQGIVADALRELGGQIVMHSRGDNTDNVDCLLGGQQITVCPNGAILFWCSNSEAIDILERMRKAFDRVLPAAVSVNRRASSGQHNSEPMYETRDLALPSYQGGQAKRILDATLPLIEGGRVILLNGKPGVGKTTMAQLIARDAKLGRTVLLGGDVVGSRADSSFLGARAPVMVRSSVEESLRLFSPGVAIVDDVDKISMSLSTLEELRKAARLVVLTANNGEHDSVLDGAFIRAGRVDEVFEVEPVAHPRVAPFDRLTDAEWDEVSQWPIAYTVEVEKRLRTRPDNVRLDDLRSRLQRRTRSGVFLGD